MKRTNYFNYIEEKLNFLAYRIKKRGRLNLLDFNIHSETFFADLCNIIFDMNLVNLNTQVQNIEGIDLKDDQNKVIIQVSATCTKGKIESSLSKKIYKNYDGYNYKFISISKKASDNLKRIDFKNPYNMKFNPIEDIWDIDSFHKKIISAGIDTQRILFDFIKKELGQEVDYVKIESNLAKVINILAEEKLDINAVSPEVNPFAIENKINYNLLQDVEEIIEDYKIYYHKLDEIYCEFDKEGKNKSFSILQEIRKQYIKLNKKEKSPKNIFFEIIDGVTNIIIKSSNYVEIPIEELQTCVDILVVDAFIRCKIFKNPEGYNHVITR
ncbi:ABC-three component system protein [Oceanivirga salmonicida]|uniref:ABC-three component system protein n=1 Tax=Oceanivirga salmonicida TaxID=1769291 RepID=UPI0012E0F2B8|nr:ABC-three component system protein [Oceanivirga salmonicida]